MRTENHQLLIVVSSVTGNTMVLARALEDAFPGTRLVRAGELPEDLNDFDPVFLGFWCDRGRAPEDMVRAAARLVGKRIACFATMGGDPTTPGAERWMRETSEALAASGTGNTLVGTFLSRGRIAPALFSKMSEMMGGKVDPEREARRRASETHPDRLDLLRAVEAFRGVFGTGL